MEARRKEDLDSIDILLVDDRKENLLSLESVLLCPEYNLITANSGDEALRYLLDHTPALILMDVQMPTLSGFEAASIIKSREKTREIPIIFITAIDNDQQFVHRGYDYGAVDYIYKPYDPHVLRSKVAAFAEIRRQHGRIARLVAIQQAATQALERFSSVDEAITHVLRSICTSLRWDVGTFWRVDRQTGELRCRAKWHDGAPGASAFLAESFRKRFSTGMGFPGRIWAGQRPIWISDILNDGNFPRFAVAAKEGLHTALGIPISVLNETMGVLEFYSSKKLIEDTELMRILGAIGSQIGQVLKRTEAFEMVQTGEARKTAILESALDCIISVDHDGKVVEFNPAAELAFVRTRTEVCGKGLSEILRVPSCANAGHRELKHCLASGEGSVLNRRIEASAIRPGNAEFPVELTITRVPTLEPPLFTCFLRDITERKRVEATSSFLTEATAALASSLNYQETFSTLAGLSVKFLANWCVIDVIDEDREVARPVAVAHSDPSKTELTASLREHYKEDWNALVNVHDVIRAGKPEIHPVVTDEMLVKATRDPEHLIMMRAMGIRSVMSVPLVARRKSLGAITFVSTDPARRYRRDDLLVAEELARRAAIAIDNARLYRDAQEAIMARDEFLSIASHELKTPITSLKLLLQITQRGVNPEEGIAPSPDKLAKMLTSSTRQVNQLTHLIEDLLDVVKIRAGKLSFSREELNLSELVKELVERYSGPFATAKCKVEVKIEPEVTGLWDRTRIEQVVVNLISNAIKYAPGKSVKIEVSEDAGIAKLLVGDSGPGIARDLQAKIFERFERAVSSRNVTGLGLGLFIVKQIVATHGGTVHLDSQEGVGSTFMVELPTGMPAGNVVSLTQKTPPHAETRSQSTVS